MTSVLSKQQSPRPGGWAWFPWSVAGMLAVTITANGLLAFFAGQSFPGTVEEHAFDRGNHYNAILSAAARQADLGWRVSVRIDGDYIRVDLADRAGAVLDRVAGTVSLRRPVGSETVETCSIIQGADGVYRCAEPLPGRGQWDLELAISRGDDQFRMNKRVLAP